MKRKIKFSKYFDIKDKRMVIIDGYFQGEIRRKNREWCYFREIHPDDKREDKYQAFSFESTPFITANSLEQMRLIMASLRPDAFEAYPQSVHYLIRKYDEQPANDDPELDALSA